MAKTRRSSGKKKSKSRPYLLVGEPVGGLIGAGRTLAAILFKKDDETAFGRIAGAALVTVIAAGAALGVGPLREHVGDTRADPLDVRFQWPTLSGETQTWLPQSIQHNLIETVLTRCSPNPLDTESLEEAQWALLQTGWFPEPGPTVTRRPRGVIDVAGAWRAPAAVVRVGSVDHLVAWGGELLPPEYRAGTAWPLRVIEHPWASPPTDSAGQRRPGQTWVGGDVQAGLDLLALLRTRRAWEHVAGVDIGGFLDHNMLVIRTTEGAEVAWGAAPGAAAPGEQPDAEKLHRFDALLGNSAWINAGRPRVDLYTPYVYFDESAAGAKSR
ncbi:MAG: hypothetical protein H6814_07590 [Phycisphaeraceae bacterium]|nr:hypothetical protein [Phycisphaeraceae bacterium]